jgi:hypothetical protein
MQGLEFAGLGGLLLLVLPVLSLACVLLTAPVARIIGRRQHEEEQVARAPLLVAVLAVGVQMCLAFALGRHPGLRAPAPLPLGPLYFELTSYAVASVFCLSAFVLVLLAATELSRAEAGVLSTAEVAAVLLAWGAECFLALAGGMPTALMGLWLVAIATSVLLLIEALKHARRARLWLIGWAVAVPLGALLLLLAFRNVPLGSDMLDARVALRSVRGYPAHGALLRLWLAGGLVPVAGLIAFAAIPRVTVSRSPGPLVFTGGALTGTLPALYHLTAGLFPAGALLGAELRLGPQLRAVWVAVAIVALVMAYVRLSAYRRLCLLSVGCVCGSAWALTLFSLASVPAAQWTAAATALALPLCLGATLALEAARLSPTSTPRHLPLAAILLFPVCALVSVAWPGSAALRAGAGAALSALILCGLLAAAAWVAAASPLLRERLQALRRGCFTASAGGLRRSALIGELAVLVVWLILGVPAIGLWSAGLRELVR